MAREATKKQKVFAKAYVETGNGTRAALMSYDTKNPDVAKSIASENLTKPNVRALIEGFAEKAAKNVQLLADTAENEAVRLNANKDVLDRAGYKPIEKTMNVNLGVEITNPLVEELAEKLNNVLKGTDSGSDGIKTSAMGIEAPDKE